MALPPLHTSSRPHAMARWVQPVRLHGDCRRTICTPYYTPPYPTPYQVLVNTLSKAMQNLGGLEGRLGEKFDARITKLNMDIDEKADERANDTVSACVSTYCAFRKSRGSSASGSPERTALADAERGAWLVTQRGAWATNALADATTKQAKIGCIVGRRHAASWRRRNGVSCSFGGATV